MKDFYTKEEMQGFTADQFLEFAELIKSGGHTFTISTNTSSQDYDVILLMLEYLGFSKTRWGNQLGNVVLYKTYDGGITDHAKDRWEDLEVRNTELTPEMLRDIAHVYSEDKGAVCDSKVVNWSGNNHYKLCKDFGGCYLFLNRGIHSGLHFVRSSLGCDKFLDVVPEFKYKLNGDVFISNTSKNETNTNVGELVVDLKCNVDVEVNFMEVGSTNRTKLKDGTIVGGVDVPKLIQQGYSLQYKGVGYITWHKFDTKAANWNVEDLIDIKWQFRVEVKTFKLGDIEVPVPKRLDTLHDALELMYQGSDVDLNDIVSKFKQQFEGE